MTLAISEYYFRLAIAGDEGEAIPFDQLRGLARVPCTGTEIHTRLQHLSRTFPAE